MDNLEIMVESKRICCQDNNASNIDACGFSIKGSFVQNVYTLSSKADENETVEQRLNTICQQYIEENPPDSKFILVYLRHNGSAWVSNKFLSNLKEGPFKTFKHLGLSAPLFCAHSHSKTYKYNERDTLQKLKKGMFRWSSFTMSHQISFMNLNGENLEIEIT